MTLRKPRNLECGQCFCYYSKAPLAPLPYGSVWLQIATLANRVSRKSVADAKRAIEKSIRKDGLTFARWAPITHEYNVSNRGYVWHVAADVVWDDVYEKVQVPYPMESLW